MNPDAQENPRLGPARPPFYLDTIDDHYAVKFGIRLYHAAYAPDHVVTVKEFRDLLTSYDHLREMAIRSVPTGQVENPNWPYWPGYFYNSGKPKPAWMFPTFQ